MNGARTGGDSMNNGSHLLKTTWTPHTGKNPRDKVVVTGGK